jgi:hypothetical protein
MKYRHGDWAVLPATPMPNQRAGRTLRQRLRGRFDLIIGSDLLYDRDHSLALAGFIGRHARADAEVWIVDPDRGNRGPFNRSSGGPGFHVDRAAAGPCGAWRAAGLQGAAADLRAPRLTPPTRRPRYRRARWPTPPSSGTTTRPSAGCRGAIVQPSSPACAPMST